MPHLSNLQITGLTFSSLDSDYIYIQGVDYEVSFSNIMFLSANCKGRGVSLIDINIFLSLSFYLEEFSLYSSIFS